MNETLISVIIPVYQGENYLAEALDSILAQNYRPIEVVVVDDGSTDGTAAIAQSYPLVHYIHQPNQGHSVAKNTGLANCTGGLIAFLDADDYWPPDKLAIESDYLKAHPEVGCVLGKMRNFLDGGIEKPRWIPEAVMAEDWDALSLGASLSHRWVFDRIGHFNDLYWHGNDLDWFIRLKEAGIPMVVLPEVFLFRRIHAANLSKDQNPLALERIRILKAHMDRIRGKTPQIRPGVR